MKAIVIPALAAAVIFASAAGFAQTAPPASPRANAAFVTVQPEGQWLASRFVGQAVINCVSALWRRLVVATTPYTAAPA